MTPILPSDTRTQVREHEQRLRAVESAEQLGNSSVREGSINFLDSGGVARIVLGKMPNGDYGLSIRAAGSNVADNDIISATFAPLNNEVTTQETTVLPFYTDLATPGPSTNQRVSATGNLLIVIGASVEISAAAQSAAISYQMSGANVLTPSDARMAEIAINAPASTDTRATMTYTHLFTSLNAGLTMVTAKYRSDGASTAYFKNRFLFTIPL